MNCFRRILEFREMKEAGWNRRDRHNEELWQRPGSDYLYTYKSAVRRYQQDKKKST